MLNGALQFGQGYPEGPSVVVLMCCLVPACRARQSMQHRTSFRFFSNHILIQVVWIYDDSWR